VRSAISSSVISPPYTHAKKSPQPWMRQLLLVILVESVVRLGAGVVVVIRLEAAREIRER